MGHKKAIILIATIFMVVSLTASAFAMSDEERQFLLMYFKEEELQVVSTTRSLKSIDRVAENIEVVTRGDIALMGAHTLADVLNTINGVQVAFGGAAPGAGDQVIIQSSQLDHVVVLVDGVSISYIASGNTPIDLIPIQAIERIEIIKGPASASWGSSLGGVVNIITRSVGQSTRPKATVSASYGEANTVDARADVSGRIGDLGYIIAGGTLYSDGLRPHDGNRHNDFFSKLSYDITKDTSALLMLMYSHAKEQAGIDEPYGVMYDVKAELFTAALTVKSRITDALSLELQGNALSNLGYGYTTDLVAGDIYKNQIVDKKYGGSLTADYRKGIHAAVLGGEYQFLNTKFSDLSFDEKIAALYFNDTISIGRLSVTPGLRLDNVNVENTSLKTNFLSPSLGLTYLIADKTILRGVVARGFNLPGVFSLTSDSQFFVANPDLKLEKVWSYQTGIETGALKYLWLKAELFRHDIKDAITYEDLSPDTWTYVNKAKARRQGLEFAARSLPFYNVTLSAATCITETKDRTTGETIKDTPTNTYDVSIKYDDKRSLRGILKGRYIRWNASEGMGAKYNAMVFDANIIKTIYKERDLSVDAFVAGHNLFNGSSYWVYVYKNARRWFETGLRVSF